MTTIKFIEINQNIIIDGMGKLLVFEDLLTPRVSFDKRFLGVENTANMPVSACKFTTKKGREAIKITKGGSHLLTIKRGKGDRGWGGFQQLVGNGVLLSEAVATSNGGGCWLEIHIVDCSSTAMTKEQAEYLDEIS